MDIPRKPRKTVSSKQAAYFKWLGAEKFAELRAVGERIGHTPHRDRAGDFTGMCAAPRCTVRLETVTDVVGKLDRHQFNQGAKTHREYLAAGHTEDDWASLLRDAGLRARRADLVERTRKPRQRDEDEAWWRE